MGVQKNNFHLTWLRSRWPVILVVAFFALIIFGFPPALPAGINGAGTGLKISTNKFEYNIGDEVNATFYIVNSLPVPVRLEPYNTVEISARRNGVPQGGTQSKHITWGTGAKITIPPKSQHKIDDVTFKARETGNLTINLNIYVRNDLAGSTEHTVKIKPFGESVIYSESDMSEIIRLSLTTALVDKRIPGYNLIKDNIILSTENIREDLVPEIPGVNLVILEPDDIQLKADREGDLLYLRFKLELQNDRNAIVRLENYWMMSETSTRLHLSGGELWFAYRKESGVWKCTLLGSTIY